MRTVLVSLLSGLCLVTAPLDASAQDTWSDPFPGVRYLHRVTPRPLQIHALFIDLDAPGIAFTVNRHEHRNIATGRFARLHGAMAAINGGLCGEGGTRCKTLQRGRYETWPDTGLAGSPDTIDTPWHGNLVFGPEHVELVPQERVIVPEDWMSNVVTSRPMVLEAGVVVTEFPTDGGVSSTLCGDGDIRHPRTSAGLSEDNGTLILVVVDGRSSESAGLTCPQLGRLMGELGAHWALNLDGGGSSTMWVRDRGVVNVPSDGAPRTVANHVGVFALGAAYDAELVAITAPEELVAGEESVVRLEYRNTGTDTWEPGQVGLRTTVTRDHESVLATAEWRSPSRPTGLMATTAPGDVGTFEFPIRAPDLAADEVLVEHFGLLLEHYGPFEDIATWFGPPDETAQLRIAVRGASPQAVDAGSSSALDASAPDASTRDPVTEPPSSMSGGCGIASARGARSSGMAALAVLLVLVMRRRRV